MVRVGSARVRVRVRVSAFYSSATAEDVTCAGSETRGRWTGWQVGNVSV